MEFEFGVVGSLKYNVLAVSNVASTSPNRGTTVLAGALPRNCLWGCGEESMLVGGIPDLAKHRVPVPAPPPL